MKVMMTIIKIQPNSYLFTCELNSSEAIHKVSASKKKETTKHKQTNKQTNKQNTKQSSL
jgi:hypothetical protein